MPIAQSPTYILHWFELYFHIWLLYLGFDEARWPHGIRTLSRIAGNGNSLFCGTLCRRQDQWDCNISNVHDDTFILHKSVRATTIQPSSPKITILCIVDNGNANQSLCEQRKRCLTTHGEHTQARPIFKNQIFVWRITLALSMVIACLQNAHSLVCVDMPAAQIDQRYYNAMREFLWDWNSDHIVKTLQSVYSWFHCCCLVIESIQFSYFIHSYQKSRFIRWGSCQSGRESCHDLIPVGGLILKFCQYVCSNHHTFIIEKLWRAHRAYTRSRCKLWMVLIMIDEIGIHRWWPGHWVYKKHDSCHMIDSFRTDSYCDVHLDIIVNEQLSLILKRCGLIKHFGR